MPPTHLLTLGLIVLLIVLVLEKAFTLSKSHFQLVLLAIGARCRRVVGRRGPASTAAVAAPPPPSSREHRRRPASTAVVPRAPPSSSVSSAGPVF